MPITQAIADFADALAATKAELGRVNVEIEELEAKRQRIAAQPPHADDIVAALNRGLASAATEFHRQLGQHLNAANARAETAVAAVRTPAQLLTVGCQKPARDTLFPMSDLSRSEAALSAAAVTYFLRDKIAAEVWELVDKLCPDAKHGLPAVERAGQLQEVDAQLTTLRERRDALQADIGAARAVIR